MIRAGWYIKRVKQSFEIPTNKKKEFTVKKAPHQKKKKKTQPQFKGIMK